MNTQTSIDKAVRDVKSINLIEILDSLEELVVGSGKLKKQSYEDFEQLNIAESLQADSLSMVRFIVLLEQHYSVQLDDEVVIDVETFGELANAIYDAYRK